MVRRALLCLVIASPLLALGLAGQAGLRYNHSESFPAGVYRTVPKHPAKGDLVTFQPPTLPVFDLARERGYIERSECMLKRLMALGGDLVTIDDAGVTVNGRMLPNSVPRPTDLAGRPMPVCRLQGYRLQAGEVLVMSDYSPISFDSRYFGPIAREQIQAVVRPVWTW
jgi:conjugative transfer signal peptidase TraF